MAVIQIIVHSTPVASNTVPVTSLSGWSSPDVALTVKAGVEEEGQNLAGDYGKKGN